MHCLAGDGRSALRGAHEAAVAHLVRLVELGLWQGAQQRERLQEQVRAAAALVLTTPLHVARHRCAPRTV